MKNYNNTFLIHPIIKPKGISSFKAIENLKKKFNYNKIGHTGTLDPFASGLIISLIDKATKLNFLFNHLPKTYIAVAQFGATTNTGDYKGDIIKKSPNFPDINSLNFAIENFFKGSITQIPPTYSALKFNGIPAYKLIRDFNIKPDMKSKKRNVIIYDFIILNYNKKLKRITFKIKVSSGTYIRKLIQDLATKTNSSAFLLELIRTEIGPFNIKNLNPEPILPVVEIFRNYFPIKKIDKRFLNIFKNGKIIYFDYLINTLNLTNENFLIFYIPVKIDNKSMISTLNKLFKLPFSGLNTINLISTVLKIDYNKKRVKYEFNSINFIKENFDLLI